MDIIFLGSSGFAIPSLKALVKKGYKVNCVVTQPDKPKGRGLQLQGTPVKTLALEMGLRIYQPERINSKEALEFLRQYNPDLFVVSAYGQILSRETLSIPGIFSINTHASVLPKYRGASPINWALINGETTTGVTIIKMTPALDAGPVLMAKEIDITDIDTSITLEEKLSLLAADLLVDSVVNIENKNFELIDQDESRASFAPRLKKEDGLIDWRKPAQDICNLVRGCLGWPNAYTYYRGRLLKLYKTRGCQSFPLSEPSYGKIINVSKEGIVVACGRGSLLIEELQVEGKKRVRVEGFIAGNNISIGDLLGKK